MNSMTKGWAWGTSTLMPTFVEMKFPLKAGGTLAQNWTGEK